jgi:hypothetical protein
MGIDEALGLLDEFQARLDRRYEVNVDVSAALARLSELQGRADALAAKLGGMGGPEGGGGGLPDPTGGGGGGGYDPGTSPTGGPLPGPGGASGLDMMIPPGFPNDTFPLRASSGERAIIQTPAQQARGGGGGISVSVNIHGQQSANPHRVGRILVGQVANRLGVRGSWRV